MKYMVVALAITILLTATGLALECQYTENETDQRTQVALVLENSLIKQGDVLNISDFISGEQSTFTVYNPNDFDIFAKFTYNVSGHSGGSKEKGLKLQARNYTIFKHYCYDGTSIGNCSIDSDSVNYQVVQPNVMVQREVQVPYNRTVCRKCCQGDCLNDDTQCSKDCECGSNLCNIARTCGQTWIAPCPDGSVNCNNQSCLKPSTKEVGEGYACEWECKSKAGNNSVCVKNADMVAEDNADSVKNTVLFSLVAATIGLILLVAAWYVKKKKLDPLTSRISELTKEIQDDEKLVAKTEDKIALLKKEVANAEGTARTAAESALRKQEELLSERKQKLDDERRSLDAKSKELDEKYNELDLKHLRDLKARYPNTILNGEGYPVFGNNPRNSIHRYVYKKNFEEMYGRKFDESRHVHHIDANRLNSLDMKNLIDITEAQHDRIPHWKIKRGNWPQGLRVMMDALNWDESVLPTHIREHLHRHR